MKKGKVYLIGAGPAGKDLITVRGLGILQQADVVIYDYLTDGELLEEPKQGAELICTRELGKDRRGTSIDSQTKINALMIAMARKGKIVARLKNGDPLIFGRANEEIEALRKNRIEFEIVPGVTAACAAAAYSGIPLTDRKDVSSVTFVTGHESREKTKSTINWNNFSGSRTIVLYMALENILNITSELIKAGKAENTPVAVISNAGRITQKVVVSNLKDISEELKKEGIISPAIFIIGENVPLVKKFNWLKINKRVLFTGLSEKRFFLKGTYFHQPMVKIIPLDEYADFDQQVKRIKNFDWIVFASRYGVRYFFARLCKIGLDARILHDIKIAAIGASTASELWRFGIRADLIPKVESSKGLLAAFKRIPIHNKRIFLPHSDLSDKGLTKGLKNLGAQVTSSIAYRNIIPEYLPGLEINSFNEIIFTSPSGVRNFVKRYGKPSKAVRIRCIGEVTRAEVKKLKIL